ncbi:MAG TPA: 3-deoxy-D-manno-octulosonic acid transferase [Tepidisphaeraceae bacterium]|nr:3-deoxy-D-manno-octulosonic acid transferase [Tepidisphaeraceae bacterium]
MYDIAYSLGVGAAAPYWLLKPSARRKVLGALAQRMGRDLPPPREGDSPTVLIHAVSLGEMNATRTLVQALRLARSDLRFVVSATTDTGFSRGLELYGPSNDVRVIRYPLDFSGAVNRVLDNVRPDVVVLMELEVWPNFTQRCQERGIPVVLANARLTSSSFRNYRLGGPLVKAMFRRLTLVCAQDETYAMRFLALGVPPHRVVITGTMKFDNANLAPPSGGAVNRAQFVGLRVGEEPVLVCGSTGPGEEAIVLAAYRRLLEKFARLRLVLVPRHPVRFDEVEQIIQEHKFRCERLTRAGTRPPSDLAIPPVVLVDAMGVLRDFYGVADVVFVGRTLVDLGPRQHGSDMIEPAALGKPVIVGPFTGNFAEAMRKLLAADAILEVPSGEQLEQSVSVLLSTPSEARAMGERAANVVAREQGATQRHARVILQILGVARGEIAPPEPGPAAREAVSVAAPPSSSSPPQRPAHPHAAQPAGASAPKVVITRLGPIPGSAPFAQGEQRTGPPQ